MDDPRGRAASTPRRSPPVAPARKHPDNPARKHYGVSLASSNYKGICWGCTVTWPVDSAPSCRSSLRKLLIARIAGQLQFSRMSRSAIRLQCVRCASVFNRSGELSKTSAHSTASRRAIRHYSAHRFDVGPPTAVAFWPQDNWNRFRRDSIHSHEAGLQPRTKRRHRDKLRRLPTGNSSRFLRPANSNRRNAVCARSTTRAPDLDSQ